jgi:hypothetical protein
MRHAMATTPMMEIAMDTAISTGTIDKIFEPV